MQNISLLILIHRLRRLLLTRATDNRKTVSRGIVNWQTLQGLSFKGFKKIKLLYNEKYFQRFSRKYRSKDEKGYTCLIRVNNINNSIQWQKMCFNFYQISIIFSKNLIMWLQ